MYGRTDTVPENSLSLWFETVTTGRVLAISSPITRSRADAYIPLVFPFCCILLYTYKRMCQTPRHRLLEVGVMKITHSMALNFHPIFILLNHLIKRILDFGLQPPARRGHRGLRPGGISDLLYRSTLSLFIKLIRRLPAFRA